MNHNKHISRSFAWLNVTQFLGALNDNVFKLLIIFFLIKQLNHNDEITITTASMVFVIPFLLFSHAAGVLADRFSKRNIIVFTKALEIIVMILGFFAIYKASPAFLYIILFIMCTQSALFGPSKYGIIPEIVGTEQLSKANSFLVGLSYLAIIIGTFIPTFFLTKVFHENFLGVAGFCILVAVVGFVASCKIEKTDSSGGEKKITPFFIADIFRTLRDISRDRSMILTVTGSAYFLYIGAFIQQNIILYGREYLNLGLIESGYLFPVAALGIGIGAVIAGRMSGRNIEFGIVPIGAMGLSICCMVLYFISSGIMGALFILFLIGVSSGLFIVPLNAFVQYRSPRKRLGEILACMNFLGFSGVLLSSLTIIILTRVFGLRPNECFLVIGVLTAVLAVGAIIILPDFLIRFLIIIITKCFYRIKTVGLDNIPVKGGALLVANHVTWVDSLLISATQQRRIRFIMARDIFENKWLKPLFKLMKVIPISPDDPPRHIIKALKEAHSALDEGSLVCIFSEGAITRNGNIRAFRPGLERILKGTDHPIIPVHIGSAWGSIFSYFHGKLFSSLPMEIPYSVSLIYGEYMSANSSSFDVRQAILELSGRSFDLKKDRNRSLPMLFVNTARKNWFRKAMSDTTGKRKTYGEALTTSIALANAIEKKGVKGDKIGLILPSSVGGALTNIAVSIHGRIPVNLNFTTSKASIEHAVKQCNISMVISSRSFLDKLEGFIAPEGIVFLEDIISGIGVIDKIIALFKAIFIPASFLLGTGRHGADDIATVIFSSGSTGKPKGIVLTHHNVISNIESFTMVFRFNRRDNICAVLPLFHSFGFTCTFWCPLINGFSASYHANPIDGAGIAKEVRENRSTILMSTPTFLLAYIRRAKREDFATLRAVIVGAEKLKTRIADSFEEKFGIRPLEGYGATELSPVASMNIADIEVDGVFQVGTKEGSVGHPVPGMMAKIVDPEDPGITFTGDREGLLMVKGPNVMKGYLNDPKMTDEVLRDGWYNTGDIARIDNDGFIFLLDRISRYSKIGGEMVPHIAIEEKIQQAVGAINTVVFIASAPDEKKGEQLVLIYTDEAGSLDDLQKIVKQSDLPNLWKPRKENYVIIKSMPTLGSGKLDLKSLKTIAMDFVENRIGKAQKVINRIRDTL